MGNYTHPDPDRNPRDCGGDLVGLDLGDATDRRYPQQEAHVWSEFAYLAVEAGGYSDITAINPYTGDRLWVGGSDIPHEFCTNRCNTCGLATRRDENDTLVHFDAAYNPDGHDHPAVELAEEPDCPHHHGGRVGIMSDNEASREYFGRLRQRLASNTEDSNSDDDETVSVYEQLRRLVDVMEASDFLGAIE